MSAIVSVVVKLTLGVLCKRLRDRAARKLSTGGLNDQLYKDIIGREIEEIKSKLNGLSQKDLLASMSFFKEGVTRLYSLLEKSSGSCDEKDGSQALLDDSTTVEKATAAVERNIVQQATEYLDAIGKMEVTSHGLYSSVKESLKEAKRLATEAFNNVALGTSDRIMASKVRIVGRILECLDDPETALRDCLLYLKELQDLPAVPKMFSVRRHSMLSRLNETKRNVNVESIQLTNALLIHLVKKHTNIRMGFLQWPTINLGNEIFHPLAKNDKGFGEGEEVAKNDPWVWEFPPMEIDLKVCALTAKGEILSKSCHKPHSLDVTNRNGERRMFASVHAETDGDTTTRICSLAVDEQDNVFIIIKITSRCKDVQTKYKLVSFDVNGKERDNWFLFITERWISFLEMRIVEDGTVVIYNKRNQTFYVIDTRKTRPDYKFRVPCKKNVDPRYICKFTFTVSNRNEIICTFLERVPPKFISMCILTMEGRLKRSVQVPTEMEKRSFMNVAFNHVNETILLSLSAYRHVESSDNGEDSTTIYTFTHAGDLLHELKIPDCYPVMLSHPTNGLTVLVDEDKALML